MLQQRRPQLIELQPERFDYGRPECDVGGKRLTKVFRIGMLTFIVGESELVRRIRSQSARCLMLGYGVE